MKIQMLVSSVIFLLSQLSVAQENYCSPQATSLFSCHIEDKILSTCISKNKNQIQYSWMDSQKNEIDTFNVKQDGDNVAIQGLYSPESNSLEGVILTLHNGDSGANYTIYDEHLYGKNNQRFEIIKNNESYLYGFDLDAMMATLEMQSVQVFVTNVNHSAEPLRVGEANIETATLDKSPTIKMMS